MRKILLFSALLFAGLAGSQVLPGLLGDAHGVAAETVGFLTMVGLSFIIVHVGYEFEIEKDRLKAYGWDYVVAMTAAGFPWIFAAGYFLFVVMPAGSGSSFPAWKEVLLAGRFAAPTASGILFAMLAAAGLSVTWMFRKARVLVIFDDLDTVLLMIPLKMLIVGFAWQLGVLVAGMVVMLWVAWRWLHRISLPTSWPWVVGYSVGIAAASEVIFFLTKMIDSRVPIHLEVLLPAFVLGCVMKRPEGADPHRDDAREGHQEGPESPAEQRVATLVSGAFMVLVGLSMPQFVGGTPAGVPTSVTAAQAPLSAGMIALHVLVLTLLMNVGKMFPALCYRKEAHWRERLAVAIGMCPRGEVGAGVILLSLDYGIGGPVVTIAVLTLALNLLLTPLLIAGVKTLLAGVPRP